MKYSQLHKSFITKYLFCNGIQEITKFFCHKSLELYGKYLTDQLMKLTTPAFLVLVVLIPISLMIRVFLLQVLQGATVKLVNYPMILTVVFLRTKRKALIYFYKSLAGCHQLYYRVPHCLVLPLPHNDDTAVSLDPPYLIDH